MAKTTVVFIKFMMFSLELFDECRELGACGVAKRFAEFTEKKLLY
jgi:hypothetical protein